MMGRRAAWLAWSLVALSVAPLLGGIALARMTKSTAPELPYDGAVDAVFTLATLLAFSVVGAIIASHHPRNTIGWLFCSVGLVVGFDTLARGYAEFSYSGSSGSRSLAETAAWFSSWSWTLLVVVPTTFLLLMFPDGRLPSPRWRPVAWCAVLGIIGFVVGYALEAGPLEDLPKLVNPYGIDSPVVGIVTAASNVVVGGSMVTAAVSLVVRARRAGRVERQQIKWLAYGGVVVVGTIFVSGGISVWSETASIAAISLGLLGLPVFTGVAIMRHRLYDVDVLINRTLVYGSVTVLLAATYVGGVVSLQYLFRALTGQGSTLAVVASTLAIAALFNPLRRRVQGFIDRRFYRRKYDAAKTLEAFNSRLREETNLDTLREDVAEVAKRTMQPAHISLWLRPDPEPEAKSGVLEQFGHQE